MMWRKLPVIVSPSFRAVAQAAYYRQPYIPRKLSTVE
jgi:hypothetical protein